jgi:general secretion pathway protein K
MTRKTRQQGYALILVLWVLTLLTMVSVTFVATARTESRMSSAALRIVEGRAVAEAGVWLAVSSVVTSGGESVGANTTPTDFAFGASTVTVAIQDVSGLINLNRASADLLDAAFVSTIADASARAQIVNAILDWRDVDSDARAGGFEPVAYDTSWGSVPVRNGSFMTVDELRAIPGMTEETFQAVREFFTVFGNHARINRLAASAHLLAILTDENEIPERRFLQDRGENIFAVRATTVVGGVTVTLSPIIHISPRSDEAVSVLSWGSDES